MKPACDSAFWILMLGSANLSRLPTPSLPIRTLSHLQQRRYTLLSRKLFSRQMKIHYPPYQIAAFSIISLGISAVAVQNFHFADVRRKASSSVALNQPEVMLAQRTDGRTCRTINEDGEKRKKCCISWTSQTDGNTCVYN